MDFPNVSFDSPAEYESFILRHNSAERTEKAAWNTVRKSGKRVIPYSQSAPQESPVRDSIIYFEFVDEDLNIYVDFFDRDTEAWLRSYKFSDPELAWTIEVDNCLFGDPLGRKTKTGGSS